MHIAHVIVASALLVRWNELVYKRMSAIKWVLIFKKLLNRAIFCWIPTRKRRAKVNFKNTFFTTLYFNENSLEFLFDFLQSMNILNVTQMQLPYPFNLITLHFITIQSTKIVMKKTPFRLGTITFCICCGVVNMTHWHIYSVFSPVRKINAIVWLPHRLFMLTLLRLYIVRNSIVSN